MAVSADPATLPAGGSHIQLYRSVTRGVRWRLLSGNHRDVARGASEHADAVHCLNALAVLAARLGEATTTLSRSDDGRWAWRLLLDGDSVAVSGHSFDRRGRCEDAVLRFADVMPYAEVRPAVVGLWGRGGHLPQRLRPVGIPRQVGRHVRPAVGGVS